MTSMQAPTPNPPLTKPIAKVTVKKSTYTLLLTLSSLGATLLLLALIALLIYQPKIVALRETLIRSEAQSYLYRCSAALEATRDQVTQKIAPVKDCSDPLLKSQMPESVAGIVSSHIKIDDQKAVYTPGEYVIEVVSSAEERLSFDGKTLEVKTP